MKKINKNKVYEETLEKIKKEKKEFYSLIVFLILLFLIPFIIVLIYTNLNIPLYIIFICTIFYLLCMLFLGYEELKYKKYIFNMENINISNMEFLVSELVFKKKIKYKEDSNSYIFRFNYKNKLVDVLVCREKFLKYLVGEKFYLIVFNDEIVNIYSEREFEIEY